MKKSTLKNLSAIICLIGGVFSTSNAQIIYTDVNPDVTSSGTYNLDLNNDGTIDFIIQYTSKSANASGKCKGQTAINIYIRVTPRNNSKVLTSGGQPTTRMVANDLIDGSVSSWSSNLNQLMLSYEYSCTYVCFYGACGYTMLPTVSGQWNPGIDEDGFLGLRIIKNGLSYFGWLRMGISGDARSFTIKDYAFNTVKDQPILAGQSSTEYLGISPFSNLSSYFCAGNSIVVPYIISGQFSASNIVTADLSDVTGSFANPVSMGNVVSNVSGTINAVIPGLTPSGYGYRIRVRSSNPVRTSYSTPINTYVHGGLPANHIVVSGDSNLCQSGVVRLYASQDPPNGDVCTSYQWRLNGNNIPGAIASAYSATIAGDYTCIKTNGAGSVTSNIITIVANPCNTAATARSLMSNKSESSVLNEPKLKIAPNPVLSSATISFRLTHSGKVLLTVNDANGRLIKTLTEGIFTAGNHQVEWNAANVSAGVYLLRMQTAGSVQTKKLVIVK